MTSTVYHPLEGTRDRDLSKTPGHAGVQPVRFASDVVEFDFRRRQVQGVERFVRTLHTGQQLDPVGLLSADAVIERSVTSDHQAIVLARSARASILITVSSRSTAIEVSAIDDETAGLVIDEIRGRVPTHDTPDTVNIRTWFSTAAHLISEDRTIAAPDWDDIARNYPRTVRVALEAMMRLERPEVMGKLILWHGPPGTGKTTAIRALARSWASWCDAQYIADPERFFADPGYIAEVLTRYIPDHEAHGSGAVDAVPARWRLVIAEDCDEYLRASARRDAGASLGRLLNLTDGLLGQGFNTLILLTTNEELGRLHPALIRPGRCLARVEYSAFSPKEAREWLGGRRGHHDHDITLAELLALRGDITNVGHDNTISHASTGQYA